MARYDYRCTNCGQIFEVEHPMSERPQIYCPACGALAERVFEPYGIELIGSGFYNTDERSKHSTVHKREKDHHSERDDKAPASSTSTPTKKD